MINYINLVKKVLAKGEQNEKTISLFGEQIRFDLKKGFPLVTTRDINYKAAFAELACFLQGTTDLRVFKRFGVNFWDSDCSKESWQNSPHCKNENDLGKIYGFQWKHGFGFDQVLKLKESLTENPRGRRHLMVTYNPSDLDKGCLYPCYVSHQFYVTLKGELNMLVHQRSADLMIGVPFDVASFALFQSLMAKETGLIPGELIVNFGDVHIYNEHKLDAAIQAERSPSQNPTLSIDSAASVFTFTPSQASIKDYSPLGKIKYAFQVQQ